MEICEIVSLMGVWIVPSSTAKSTAFKVASLRTAAIARGMGAMLRSRLRANSVTRRRMGRGDVFSSEAVDGACLNTAVERS